MDTTPQPARDPKLVVVVDADELAAMAADPQVTDVRDRALADVQRSRAEGRRVEL